MGRRPAAPGTTGAAAGAAATGAAGDGCRWVPWRGCAMGAVAMGAVAAGAPRLGIGTPLGSNLARLAGVASWSGSADNNGTLESRLPGGSGRRSGGRCRGRRKRGRLRQGHRGGGARGGRCRRDGRSRRAGQGRRDALDHLRRGGLHIRQLAEDFHPGNAGVGRWCRFGRRRRAQRQRCRDRARGGDHGRNKQFPGALSWFSQSLDGERLRPKLARY